MVSNQDGNIQAVTLHAVTRLSWLRNPMNLGLGNKKVVHSMNGK
jgi:hypothetical protein